MSEQTDFLKTVREGLTSVQTVAARRLEALEGDARKALGELVEKGRDSQKELAERLGRLTASGSALEGVVQSLRGAGGRAVAFVDATGREQAVSLAGELRRIADLLEKVAVKKADAPAATPEAQG
jgi:DNA-binding Lrp family transcriptional regulator